MLAPILIPLAAALLAVLIISQILRRLLPSTRAFIREAGLGLQALHGYIYGRWTRQYIRTLFRMAERDPGPTKTKFWLARHYHGKVLTHDHARGIVGLEHDIPPQDLEQIIPFPVARKIVLQAPPDVVAYECVCRHGRAAHCEPTQVCMIIGRPFTDFILEHHPDSARRLTQAEALALLEAEHQRGHLHSAWFKDALLDRFYAICNCCKCCCGGIRTMVRDRVPIMASSGYVAEIDRELCANCYDCVEACPFGALSQDGEGVARDWERCMGCGICEVKCATGAVSLVRDGRKGVPMDVRLLAGGLE